MTRTGQTDNFKLSDFIKEISKYVGKGTLDCVIVNKTKPDPDVLEVYREKDGAIRVEDDVEGNTYKGTKIVRKDLLSRELFTQSANDSVHRSLIRHDPDKTAAAIFDVIDNRLRLW